MGPGRVPLDYVIRKCEAFPRDEVLFTYSLKNTKLGHNRAYFTRNRSKIRLYKEICTQRKKKQKINSKLLKYPQICSKLLRNGQIYAKMG